MLLLDTPSLIWWVNHYADLSATALGRIEAERPGGKILISAISAWEIALWANQNRLGLRMEPHAWLAEIGNLPELAFVPVDNEVALQAATLPEPAPEPLTARLLIATARHFGCPLVTASTKLQSYPHIKTIW